MTNFNPTFKGVWIPDFVLEMVVDGELTATDVLLLSMIHAMSKKDGCYASREYLAALCGLNEGTTKNLITKYRKMGLVIDLGFDGRRQKLCTIWDEGSRRNDGCRHVEMTPPISSGIPSSARGHVEMTADQATNNINNIVIGKNLKEEETLKKTEVEINKEVEVNPEPSVFEDIRSFSKTSQVGQPKEKKYKWGQRSFTSSKPEPNRGTLEDSLRDNLPMIGNSCGQEIKDMAKRCQVFKKDVFQKKQEYIAWVKSKPNDPSRWGLDMASTVETFINRAIASGEIEKYIPLKQQLIEAGYEIVGEKT